MNKQRALETKVGIVSVVGTILFIIGISLGKGVSVTEEFVPIRIAVSNSGGIKPGEPIMINGVERGSVKSVKNLNGGVLIQGQIAGAKDLNADATAKVLILEITGGRKIEIYPGSSAEPFDSKNVIPGRSAGDLGELVALVADLGSDAGILIKRLDTLAGEVTSILKHDNGSDKIRQAITDGSEILTKINHLIDKNYNNIDATLANLRILSADLKDLVKKNDPKIDEIIGKLNATLDHAHLAIGDIRDLSGRANNLVANIDSISMGIRYGDGVVNRLIYDKSLTMKLDSLVVGIDSLVNFISQHGVNVNLRLGTRP